MRFNLEYREDDFGILTTTRSIFRGGTTTACSETTEYSLKLTNIGLPHSDEELRQSSRHIVGLTKELR